MLARIQRSQESDCAIIAGVRLAEFKEELLMTVDDDDESRISKTKSLLLVDVLDVPDG